MKYAYLFMPGVPFETNEDGDIVQIIDGEEQVLSPAIVTRVMEYRDAGLDDNEILDWLKIT